MSHAMITFSAFPPPTTYDSYGSHAQAQREIQDEDEMDFDFDEDFSGSEKLRCPGETIISSHAFMRFVLVLS